MKFRKKPIVVEAEQFFPDRRPWPEGVYETGLGFWVETLEGVLRASAGDWIVTGVAGERYPVKPDIFEATYEPVGGGA